MNLDQLLTDAETVSARMRAILAQHNVGLADLNSLPDVALAEWLALNEQHAALMSQAAKVITNSPQRA